FDELRDESSPSGLMACADPAAVVSMEVLVEIDEVAPMGIALKFLELAINGTPSFRRTKENAGDPARNLGGRVPERGSVTGTRWQLDSEALAIEVMKFLERFDQQKIDWKPYRPAPGGVSSEEPSGRLGRFVVDPMLSPVYFEDVGMIFVESRNPTNAMR